MATRARMVLSSSKNFYCTAAEPGRYSTTTMAVNRPTATRTHSDSNGVGCTPSMVIGDSTTSAPAITTTPPWLTDRSSPAARGRGRSTTLYPADRNRPKTALSASCYDSVMHNRSTRRSRQSSLTSSNLFSSDHDEEHNDIVTRSTATAQKA